MIYLHIHVCVCVYIVIVYYTIDDEIKMDGVIEFRMYDSYVQCSVCRCQTKTCVFYCCRCTSIQFKICWWCRFYIITPCILCSEEEEEIFYNQFFKKKKR